MTMEPERELEEAREVTVNLRHNLQIAEARILRLEQVLRPFADQAGRAEEAMRKQNGKKSKFYTLADGYLAAATHRFDWKTYVAKIN